MEPLDERFDGGAFPAEDRGEEVAIARAEVVLARRRPAPRSLRFLSTAHRSRVLPSLRRHRSPAMLASHRGGLSRSVDALLDGIATL
jgi:hypothetical protein